MDSQGQVLFEFTDVQSPRHLSSDSEGHVLVADCLNHRILLLNSGLQLQRVLVNGNIQVGMRWPDRLWYNELTSQLYVLHSPKMPGSDVLSLYNLR